MEMRLAGASTQAKQKCLCGEASRSVASTGSPRLRGGGVIVTSRLDQSTPAHIIDITEPVLPDVHLRLVAWTLAEAPCLAGDCSENGGRSLGTNECSEASIADQAAPDNEALVLFECVRPGRPLLNAHTVQKGWLIGADVATERVAVEHNLEVIADSIRNVGHLSLRIHSDSPPSLVSAPSPSACRRTMPTRPISPSAVPCPLSPR